MVGSRLRQMYCRWCFGKALHARSLPTAFTADSSLASLADGAFLRSTTVSQSYEE